MSIGEDIDIVGTAVALLLPLNGYKPNPAPELILMDINWGWSGFEIFNLTEVKRGLFSTPVCEYALKAFWVNSVDYPQNQFRRKTLKQLQV
jgi:hypothetical protein